MDAAALRALVLAAQGATAERLEVFTRKYLKDRVSVVSWKFAAWRELKNMHTGLASVAAGGAAQMSARTERQLRKTLAYHGAYLNDLARGLEAGRIKRDEALVSRVRSYSAGAWGVFENTRRVSMHEAGILRERRVLGTRSAKHCPTCIAQANMGWQARGVLREIGDSPCGNRCDCTFEFPAAA